MVCRRPPLVVVGDGRRAPAGLSHPTCCSTRKIVPGFSPSTDSMTPKKYVKSATRANGDRRKTLRFRMRIIGAILGCLPFRLASSNPQALAVAFGQDLTKTLEFLAPVPHRFRIIL